MLIESFNKSKKGVNWKDSVEKYEINLLENTYKVQKALLEGNYKACNFVEFKLAERGKTRWIKSMHIRDRVVQRAVCDYILLPKIQNKLIYDNGASMKGKGIDFALDRLKLQLQQYYRKYGDNKGWIVLFDFTKYFDNIPHDKILPMLLEDIDDPKLIKLIKYLVSLFEIDLSVLPQDLADEFSNGVFNNLAYSAYIYNHNPNKIQYRPPEKLKKSIGVGSQISQIAGIYYPTKIDNYFKIVKGIHGYGRYMDDTYAICRTKEEAQEIIEDMRRLCAELGINLNMKKTHIHKLDTTFSFLQTRFTLTENGYVIMRIGRKSMMRNNKRLNKLSNKLAQEEISYVGCIQSYESYRGRLKRYNSTAALERADVAFYDNFTVVELNNHIQRIQQGD